MYFHGYNPLKIFAKDKYLFYSFYITSFCRVVYAKITKEKLRTKIYAGKRVYSQNDANEILKNAIIKGDAYMFGRNGTTELGIANYSLFKKLGIQNEVDLEKVNVNANCGFFATTEAQVHEFRDEICEATRQSDLYGCFFLVFEDYYIKRNIAKECILTHLNMMDFWRYEHPFTEALKGKKVLVVSALAPLIEEQYKKREYLFKNPEVLPEFAKFSTVKAVQTIMGNREEGTKTWIDGVEYMYNEAMKCDFDVALLSCGSYGMPLAARLKKAGKTVIYMGGVLQMLFGIRGKRWDTIPEAAAMYNEYWVSPGTAFTPQRANKVEGGCYW